MISMEKNGKSQAVSGQSNHPNGTEVNKAAGSSAGSDASSHSSSSSHKRQQSKDSAETSSASQHHTTHLNSNQSHPKKKGGFVITSVKDNVDGDESADDLDESHASYSDISYSKTVDLDHDQESSTSDETMNITTPDGLVASNNLPHNSAQASRQPLNATERKRSESLKQVQANNLKLPAQDVKGHGELTSNVKSESQAAQAGGTQSSGYCSETSNANLSHSNLNQSQGQFKVPASNKPSNPSMTNVSSVASVTAASRTGSSSSTTTSKGGSRVYKVVKRESGQPTRREIGRWVCFDYGDAQAPNLGYIIPSASDSRISAHDLTQMHNNQLPLSLSATSVPSSASAYSLQHSDSTSSVHRDSSHSYGASAASNITVQHSASASSVHYDAEGRKLSKSTKFASDSMENTNKAIEDRFAKSSADQELQNVILSSSELNSVPETEDESATNVRIDNKIEAAMDLVKKHLMQAVRDEVDELKERIVELEQDVDLMKGVLTPSQMTQIRPHLSSKFVKFGIGTLSSLNQSGQSSVIGHGTAVHLTHDTTVSSQPQAGQSHVGQSLSNSSQKPSIPRDSSSRTVNPSVVSQAKSVPQNVAGGKPNNAQISHPQQSSHQQPPSQAAIQKPPQGPKSRPVTYQQGSTVFQPIAQSSASSQQQLTAQQIQAMRQQAYQQQLSAGSQPGYQSPQVVLQQPNINSISQQPPIPAASIVPSGHPTYQQPNTHLPPHASNIIQQPPVTGTVGQPPYAPTTLPNLNRMSSVVVQGTGPGALRAGQPTAIVSTSAGPALPSMHTQSTFQPVNPPLYTTSQAPHSNTNNTIENKTSQT